MCDLAGVRPLPDGDRSGSVSTAPPEALRLPENGGGRSPSGMGGRVGGRTDMGRLIYLTLTSLDGFIGDGDYSWSAPNEEVMAAI